MKGMRNAVLMLVAILFLTSSALLIDASTALSEGDEEYPCYYWEGGGVCWTNLCISQPGCEMDNWRAGFCWGLSARCYYTDPIECPPQYQWCPDYEN